MKATRWYTSLLALIIALAVAASGYTAFLRHRLEQANRTVTVAVDYADILRMNRLTGASPEVLFKEVKDAGATAIFFKEDTVQTLSPHVFIRPGTEVMSDARGAEVEVLWAALRGGDGLTGAAGSARRAGSEGPGVIDPSFTYLVTSRRELADRIVFHLTHKFPGVSIALVRADNLFLVGTPLKEEDLRDIGLGFPEDAAEKAHSLGLDTVVQVRSWPGADASSVSAIMQAVTRFPGVSAVAFNDPTLPGYPDYVGVIARELKASGLPLATVEFFPQEGVSTLGRMVDKNVVRLHSLKEAEAGKLSPDDVGSRFRLAVEERNIRILLFRFFYPPHTGDQLGYNLSFLRDLSAGLRSRGFVLGPASGLEKFPFSRALVLVMGGGVIAAGALLLEQLRFRRLGLAWLAGGMIVWLVAGGFGWQLLAARKLMALGAACLFPALATSYALPDKKSSWTGSLMALIKASAVSLAGGLLVGGILTDVGFMVKLDQFWGVKVSYVAPLVLAGLVLLCRRPHLRVRLRRAGEAPVTWLGLVVVVSLAAGAVVYIMRSGNELAAVFPLEKELRQWLDAVLTVRPRTKEFLIGHPLLVLVAALGYRDALLPWAIVGAVGQVSITNTYAHIHTPVVVSLLRTFNGLWLGAVIGLLLVGAYRWVEARVASRGDKEGSREETLGEDSGRSV